mmetsp:Transcript_43341/g.129973  ORF Transcript_43341/g.129973 Transcript_43341/m.129973 type:complete len:475 (-) Transcript_43341:577-2001(-)
MGCGASSAGDGGDGGGHRPVPSEFATLDIGVPPFSPKAVAEAAPGGVDETAGSGGGGGKFGPAFSFKTVKSKSSVKAVVTVRPILGHEKGAHEVVQVMPPDKLQLPKKPDGSGVEDKYGFTFDRVLRADNPTAQNEIFSLCIPVVERFCQGFNASVLAYGQTGSGKTYTMGMTCGEKEFMADKPKGVVPNTIRLLFTYLKKASEAYEITVKVQYVEIYNEKLTDLLTPAGEQRGDSGFGGPPAKGRALDIREKQNGEIVIDGAMDVQVLNQREIASILDRGNANRRTGAHKQNAVSSRSHAIMAISLEQRAKAAHHKHLPTDLRYLASRLYLVDLAGSERVKDSGSEGNRLKEGITINKGLLELGNVINALAQGKKRSHVPYRNSKLTRLLANSLGGNSETLFIACVSPTNAAHDPTLNTLRYAARARAIHNQLVPNNKLSADEELEYLRNLVMNLQTEVGDLKSRLAAASTRV